MVHPHDIYSPVEPWTRRIKSFAEELVKKNHQVKLVYFPLADGDLKSQSSDGYEVIPFRRYSSPPTFIKNILRLLGLVEWADIVHFQKCHHYAAIPVVIAAYLKQKPLHYDWDDWEEMIWYESCGRKLHSRFIGFSFKVLERFLPLLVDTVSVSSHYLRDLALRYGVKEENISFAPVGADPEKFNPRIDGSQIRKKYNISAPLVLYIGQLHGAQYIDLFIEAANIVLRANREVTFVIVGEGFMEESLKDLAHGLGIEDRIIFTGSVSHGEIPQYIAAADICVAPFKETKVTRCKSPLKIVEYMAMAKPVVASNVGEVRMMLGGAGILVEPADYYSLAEGILRLLKDERLRYNIGRFARQRIERSYNWAQTTSSLLISYERLYNKYSQCPL